MSSLQVLPTRIMIASVDGAEGTRQYQLKSGHGVFLGTSANCGLILSGGGVSDMHCYVKFEDGRLSIEDWMSKTGTLVNGAPISERVELSINDVIQVGSNKITLQRETNTFRATIAQSPAKHAAFSSEDDTTSAFSIDNPAPSDVTACNHQRPNDSLNGGATTGRAHQATAPWFDNSHFETDEEETYDGETVALLRAEIDHLQAALARRDAESFGDDQQEVVIAPESDEESDSVLERMQVLIDEANRSDERVLLLETMLRAAEDANVSEQEERAQLEAWIDDIEKRVAQREAEHQGEVDLLRQRLEESNRAHEQWIKRFRQATDVPAHDHEQFEQLRRTEQKLMEELAKSQQQCAMLQQRLQQISEEPERTLREERAKIAHEHAQVARLRLEVSSKLATLDALPRSATHPDAEADHRIQTLREHLLEIHAQEQQDARSASLTTRLASLWQRVNA